MDMNHGRTIPALAAAATGTALGAAFVAIYGLGADLATSAGALTLAIAAFTAPGVAGALATAWRTRRRLPRRLVAPVVAAPIEPAVPPCMAAEAVADIRSLTEERVSRARRTARGNRRTAALAS